MVSKMVIRPKIRLIINTLHGMLIFLFAGLILLIPHSAAQELSSFKSDIPFSLRMSFFRGKADSTRCLITLIVDNRNLLFYRGSNYYEAQYEIFLSMRETKTHSLLKGDWEKKVRVPTYDETSLAAHFDPLRREVSVVPGKYEGFVEIKDVQANTYGNGRVSVTAPDFSKNLPKLSTPLFYDPGELSKNASPKIPAPEEPLREASLKYPAGKPIFLLLEIYSDSTNPPEGWKVTAEVVKALMLFPRVEKFLEDGACYQRKMLEIPTKTMGLGTYEIEVSLRDKRNSILARTSTFKFRIIKSPEWIAENSENEIRYLKYLVSDNELKRLLNLSKEEQVKALQEFWKKMDPVPATAINELRVQYFERIDYANRNFTTEQREGWETNMGEVYVMLGPPSEIYGSRLNQIWVYERENLVLTFFGHNLRNRDVFDEYIRDRRWWRDSGDSK